MRAGHIMVVIAFGNNAPCPIAGRYLKSFDFEAYDGRGYGEFTEDIEEAMVFPTAAEALEFWRTQSKINPIRQDGKPNRPLTSTTVAIRRL